MYIRDVFCFWTTLLIYLSSFEEMYFHILIGLLVLTFCSGDSSNHAISSISFHRDDVPLSYNYNYIHIYSTEKPKSHTRPEVYKNIQYAPLDLNHNDKEKYDGLYTKAIATKWNKIENVTKNDYLEPQIENSGNYYGNRQYVAGYNIDASRPNINHNNLISDYKNIALHNNNKQSFNKIIFNTNAETIPSGNDESSQLNNFLVLNARKYQENPSKSIPVLSLMENAQIHPVFNPYVKVPQLHLNVARAYNFAPMAVKALSNGYQKSLRSNQDQSYAKQTNTPIIQKTFLYPINNRQQKY